MQDNYPNKEIMRLRKRFYKKCGLMVDCVGMHELVSLFTTTSTNKPQSEMDKWYYLNKLAKVYNGYERTFVLAKDKRIFLNLKHQFYNTLVKGIDNGKYKAEYDAVTTPKAFIGYVAKHGVEDITCD